MAIRRRGTASTSAWPWRGCVAAFAGWSVVVIAGCLMTAVSHADEWYGGARGPLAIGVVETLTWHDVSRDKVLQLRLTFPVTTAAVPLLIWSHGAKGTKDMYGPLIEYWASHGYLCIQVNHNDSRAFGFTTDKRQTFRDWAERPRDISAIIDALSQIVGQLPLGAPPVDDAVIGVGGHSFGAHTAQLLAGATTVLPDGTTQTFTDTRIRAVMLLSPQGLGAESMLREDSWRTVTRPLLSITGSNDLGRTGRTWTWRLDPFLRAASPDDFLLLIDDAYHGFGGLVGFDDFPNAGPPNAAHMQAVRSVSLAFWDGFLKAHAPARDFLDGQRIASLSQQQVRLYVAASDRAAVAQLQGGSSDSVPLPPPAGETAVPSLPADTPAKSRPPETASSQPGAGRGTLSAERIIQSFDRDGDGRLAPSEMPPRLAPAFDHLDRDGDGAVSERELAHGLSRLDGR